MKEILLVSCFLMIFGCQAQKKQNVIEKHEIVFKNDIYHFELRDKINYHSINLYRASDSLKLKMRIKPSMRKFFDSFLFRSKNESISFTLRKEVNDYMIEQIDFIHMDGRNTVLHKYSDDKFDLDISEHKIEMIECNNCKERISFTIYNAKWDNVSN